MNSFEVKKILQIYRPGTDDSNDRQIAEALLVAKRSRELDDWLREYTFFQTAVREKFQQIPVPAHLKEAILSQPKIIHLPWWRNAGTLRAAASIVLLIGLCVALAGLWKKPPVPDRFVDYQSRMARSALREYRMDLVTNDLEQVRQLMTSKGAPSDFSVPKGLAQLQLSGGGVLRWRNNPVAMVCFNRGDDQMLFLFVMARSAVKDPPSTVPELAKNNKLQMVSWSDGDKTYLLAGPDEMESLRKYL